jgi:hypothetical protein
MSRYPLCEKLGLKVKCYDLKKWAFAEEHPSHGIYCCYVGASELERLLSEGVAVFGPYDISRCEPLESLALSKEAAGNDKFSGLILNYKPIEKEQPVTKEEIIKFIEDYSHSKNSSAVEFVNRLKKAGVK